MAQRSPFDDLAFLDPQQSHQSTQATTLTLVPSQTRGNDAQHLHPQPQNPLEKPHDSTASSSSSASIGEQNLDKLSTLFSPLTATTVTPTLFQTQVHDAQNPQPHLQNPPQKQHDSALSVQEQNIDKFATLFSPSTPRASPVTFPPAALPDEEVVFDQTTHVKSHTHAHGRTESTSSNQSDFGLFVSVPSFEDPLSVMLDIASFEEHGMQEPSEVETPSTATAPAHSAAENVDAEAQTRATAPRFALPPALPPPPIGGGRSASRASSSSTSSTSKSTRASSTQMNATLSFFDQFAQDARERSSATRSLLLDELLLHQDDPLYFLKDQKSDANSQNDVTTPSAGGLLSPPLIPLPGSTPSSIPPAPPLVLDPPSIPAILSSSPMRPIATPLSPHPQSLLDLNADLEHDYFRVPPPQTNPSTPLKHANPRGHTNIHIHPHLARSPPTRSSSIPVPVPTLAPPIESPEGAMRLESEPHARSPPAAAHLIDLSHHLPKSGAGLGDDFPDIPANHDDPEHPEDGTSSSPSSTSSSRLSLPARSSSYNSLSGSLSSLPGKWMSTLLRGAQPPTTTPTLESIFSSASDASVSTAPTSDSSHLQAHPPSSRDSAINRRNSTSASTSPQRRRPTQSQSEYRQQPTFTHTSAFAPPPTTSTLLSGVSHGASPFAPHTYVPPSGAPGFKGDSYTWDKGFSEDLEAEAEKEREAERQRGREGYGNGTGNGNGRDLRTGHVKAKTVPGVGRENILEDSSRLGSGSGWGSGFGFSFGSVRAGKGKVGPFGSGSYSASTSTSGLSPSGSVMASTSVPNVSERMRTSPAHLAESGRSEGSWNAQTHGYERDRTTPGSSRTGEMGSLNVGDDADHLHGEFNGEVGQRSGYGAKKRPLDSREQEARRNAPGDEPGGGMDGIGAFIERKSGNVELKGRRAATTPVLMPELAGMIRPHLPALSRLPRSWTLIYSLDQDGISLNTLYTRCEAHLTRRPSPGEVLMNNSAMLIAVQDAEGGVFGVWLAEGVRLNKSGRGYFGGGESFLWKYSDNKLKVFKCTGKNNYIALCEPDYISFGGGDGHYGMYLDDTLFDGSSAPCPTFDNEPLCFPGPKKGASVTFECVGLEVWGMGT